MIHSADKDSSTILPVGWYASRVATTEIHLCLKLSNSYNQVYHINGSKQLNQSSITNNSDEQDSYAQVLDLDLHAMFSIIE